ncbi:hypothetical protein Tco_0052704 [Tanacetum coccineum]
MLRKGLDFSEESIERAGGKNWLIKVVRSSSHVSMVPSLSSSSQVLASLVILILPSDWFPLTRVKWLPLMEKSCTDSGMVIAKPGVGATTGFIIHWIVIFKNIKKVTKIADVKNRWGLARHFRNVHDTTAAFLEYSLFPTVRSSSLKVYNEEEKDKIGVRGIDRDRLAVDVKVKTIEDSDYASVLESITRLPAFTCQQFKEVYKVKELMKRINAQRPKAVLRS